MTTVEHRGNARIVELAAITHEGKVIVVGTGADGVLLYTIRQSGFEDTAVMGDDPSPGQAAGAPSGFEPWRPLPLGLSLPDRSVVAFEKSAMVDRAGSPIVRSRYGRDATGPTSGRVKLVSALGHLYVFRLGPDEYLLLDRFVLDGMTNQLVPKLEVRYRRSRQRLVPDGGSASRPDAKTLDSLGYRDVDQNSFYEATLELSFLGRFDPTKPWFSVELVDTAEHERHRWHFFVMVDGGLQLVSVAASPTGLVELRDRSMLEPDPDQPDVTLARAVPGIIERRLAFDGMVAAPFDTTVYHNQVERMTRAGRQLLKENTRIMLGVPVRNGETGAVNVAAVSFAIDHIGLLAPVDTRADGDDTLRGHPTEVLLPLDDLDSIRVVADRTPPPQGSIVGLGEAYGARTMVLTGEPVAELIHPGQQVKIGGTRSFDGIYVARGVEEGAFEIEIDQTPATADDGAEDQGFWEVIDDEPGDLVFENMIASYQRTESGTLRVRCLSHNLDEGDEIRISGSVDHDGVYPITGLADDNSFEIDRVWPVGEVVNLARRPRRGLAFDGEGDYLTVDPIGFDPLSPRLRFERTVSAWVYLTEATGEPQAILVTGSETLNLHVDGDGRPTLEVRFADGHRAIVADTEPLPIQSWIHVAAQVDYRAEDDGSTGLRLFRSGHLRAESVVEPSKSKHLPLRNVRLDDHALPVETMSHDLAPLESITVEAWVKPDEPPSGQQATILSWSHGRRFEFAVSSSDGGPLLSLATGDHQLTGGTALEPDAWHHVAATFDRRTGRRALYVDGELDAEETNQVSSGGATGDGDGQEETASTEAIAALARTSGQPLRVGFVGGRAVGDVGGREVVYATDGVRVLRPIAPGTWEEQVSGQPRPRHYSVTGTDRWSLHLVEEATGARVEIDLFRRKLVDRSGTWQLADETPMSDDPGSATGSVVRVDGAHSVVRLAGTYEDSGYPLWEWSDLRSGKLVSKLVAVHNDASAIGLLMLQDGLARVRHPTQAHKVPWRPGSPLPVPDYMLNQSVDLWLRLDDEFLVFHYGYRRPEPISAVHTSDDGQPIPIAADATTATHAGGRYQLAEAGSWQHLDEDGEPFDGPLVETGRDTWSIHLRSEAGDRRIELDYLKRAITTRVSEEAEPVESDLTHFQTVPSEAEESNRFAGYLADLRVWNRARSARQISRGRSVAARGDERNLVASWDLAETTAEYLPDASADNVHLGVPSTGLEWWVQPHRAPGVRAHYEPGGFEEPVVIAARLDTRPESALVLDGAGGHLKLPSMTDDLEVGLTVLAWVRWDAFPNWSRVIDFGNGQNDANIILANEGPSNTLTFWTPAGSVSKADALTVGTWVHLAATVDDQGGATLFVDGQPVADGLIGRVPSTRRSSNFIGRSNWDKDPTFDGAIRDVQIWGRPLAPDEVRRAMHSGEPDHDDDLLHHWPMVQATVKGKEVVVDRGAATPCHGQLRQGATIEQVTGELPPRPAGGFRGKLSDVQLWEVNRPAKALRETMHDQLTGNEHGLRGYWRLGGIVEDRAGAEGPRRVSPDFSIEAADAVVNGDVFVSARDLARQTSAGLAVAYTNDDLVAVTQGARYRESFEFRAVRDDGEFLTGAELEDISGRGDRIFEFDYWGAASRTSGDRTPFSFDESYEFTDLGDGWHRARCDITIPTGVNLIRCFGLDEVTGRWIDQLEPPPDEWVELNIRKHRLHEISDRVSRRRHTDQLRLPTLVDGAGAVDRLVDQLPSREAAVASKRVELAEVLAAIRVGSDPTPYEQQRDQLKVRIAQLETRVASGESALASARAAHAANPLNGYSWLKNLEGNTYLSSDEHGGFTSNVGSVSDRNAAWRFDRNQDGTYTIQSGRRDRYLRATEDGLRMTTDSPTSWRLAHQAGAVYQISCHASWLGERRYLGDSRPWYDWSEPDEPEFADDGERAEPSAPNWELVGVPADQGGAILAGGDFAVLEQTVAVARAELEEARSTLAEVEATLQRARSDRQELEARRDELEQEVAELQDAINKINRDYLELALSVQSEPQTMRLVAEDRRGLTVYGAVLGFAEPVGGLTLAATAEGNVQVSYFDSRGRVRATQYDATSDSVNAAYEQWLPSNVALCPELTDPLAVLAFDDDQAIELPSSGSTVEAWIAFPPPDGAGGNGGRNLAMVTSDAGGASAAIAIADGRRLGSVADGLFNDAGVDLRAELDPGWHHVAAVNDGATTRFHLDGRPVGGTIDDGQSRSRARFAIDFDGERGHLELGEMKATSHDFSGGLTIQGWVRFDSVRRFSRIVDFGNGGGIDNIVLCRHAGTDDLNLTIFSGDSSQELRAPGCIQVGRWINVAATVDGNGGVLYVDGLEVASGGLHVPATVTRSANYIGRSNWATDPLFHGSMSELHVWSRALSADQVRAFATRSPVGSEDGLIHYWPMSVTGGEGESKAVDAVEGGLDGRVVTGSYGRTLPTGITAPIVTFGNAPHGDAPIGRLAEVRIWDGPLTDDEILANSLGTPTGNEPGLLAHYPLDDVTGPGGQGRDRCGRHGPVTLERGQTVPRAARIGNPGAPVTTFDGRISLIRLPGLELDRRSFTIEFWVKRHRVDGYQWILDQGANGTDRRLHIGFRDEATYTLAFDGNDLDVTQSVAGEHQWVHVANVYDHDTGYQLVYFDGLQVGSRQAPRPFVGQGDLVIGGLRSTGPSLDGQLAELRIWDHARSAEDITADRFRRVQGIESGLLVALPLDDGGVTNRVVGGPVPETRGTGTRRSIDLPLSQGRELVTAEYSTVGLDADGRAEPMLRRFTGFTGRDGSITLVPGRRIEALDLRWIGNAQFEPTLLGYIEGPPPVPSENLTVDYDYDGATSIELTRSEDIEYTWTRDRDIAGGLDIGFFVGAAWEVSGGFGVESLITEGEIGVRGNVNAQWRQTESSTIRAGSTNVFSDRIELRGSPEVEPRFPHLGTRYVPKNIGYALVVSGLADVFILQTRRSRRMVSYQVLPVEDVPLDINTITFLINPAYSINGSLDGLVGTEAADPDLYRHVPEMRAQYGSRYPAGYFDLANAYHLKAQIDRWDKQRESYFVNFDARETGLTDRLLDQTADESDFDSYGGVDMEMGDETTGEEDQPEDTRSEADVRRDTVAKYEGGEDEGKEATSQRQDEIEQHFDDQGKRTEALAAFASWQQRMESLQIQAAKRNIVNTYVWDADGGMRSEEQNFANTIEHTIGGSFSLNASLGLDANVTIGAFKFELQAMGTFEMTQTMTKTATTSRALDLVVQLDGLETKGITDSDDYPVVPGQKVDRYRFMSFYLEGDTDHFRDFFDTVVDPEWLASNDEEARALRQVAAGRPNKAWRVLHRVTFVERPTLMGFGRDLRPDSSVEEAAQEVFNYFDALEQANATLRDDLAALRDEVVKLRDAMAGQRGDGADADRDGAFIDEALLAELWAAAAPPGGEQSDNGAEPPTPNELRSIPPALTDADLIDTDLAADPDGSNQPNRGDGATP